jgi:hypothetical protein
LVFFLSFRSREIAATISVSDLTGSAISYLTALSYLAVFSDQSLNFP